MNTDERVVVTYPLSSVPVAITTVESSRLRTDLHRIVVPPLASWRLLSRGYLVGVPMLAACFIFMMFFLMCQRPFSLSTLVMAGASNGIPLTAAILAASHRLSRRLTFEVTPFEFTKISIDLLGLERIARPRSDVRDIGLNRLTGKLVVCAAGRDTYECFLTVEAVTNRYIADELQRAFLELPVAPLNEQQRIEISEAMPTSPRRSIIVIVAMVLSVAGMAVTIVIPGGACLWFLPAAIATGLVFGRQTRKEMWF